MILMHKKKMMMITTVTVHQRMTVMVMMVKIPTVMRCGDVDSCDEGDHRRPER